MVMAYLLDTNAWIQLLKSASCHVAEHLRQVAAREVLLCSVVKAELWHVAQKYGNRDRRLAVLEQLFSGNLSVPFDDVAAVHYGDIRHQLETQGAVIGPHDLQIAAICRSRSLTLVSSDTEEFGRVTGLTVLDGSKS